MTESAAERTTKPRTSLDAIHRPSRFWWLYFALVAVLGIIGLSTIFSGQMTDAHAIGTASTLLDLIAIVGLFCFIRAIRLGSKLFWRMVFVLYSFKTCLAVMSVANNAIEFGGMEQRVALLVVFGALLALPMIIALYRYGTFLTTAAAQRTES
ncbi:MAG: hypothetical protein Q4G62_09660 [Pseudomonadota bacterium]|nr:hypothetical protein [Pseudomonadota bacterium]